MVPSGLLIGMTASVGIGLSLGLVGAGGSILTVPILVYVLDVPPAEAVGVSLAVVATTSLVGAVLQYRAGLVDLRSAGLFAAVGFPGAWVGSHLTGRLSSEQLMLAFGAVMVVASAAILGLREPAQGTQRSLLKAGLAAAVTGLVTGFLGVGGGFLVVPALLLFAGLPARTAMGTSLLVIAANSLVGLGGALQHGHFQLAIAVAVSGASIAGMFFGTRFSRRLSPKTLRRGFAVVALLMATYVLARTVLPPPLPEAPSQATATDLPSRLT